MQYLGDLTETSISTAACAAVLDLPQIVTECPTVAEAKALPRGCVVGDLHGGLTFSDAVAAALESRSVCGWQEFVDASGTEHWTIIVVNR